MDSIEWSRQGWQEHGEPLPDHFAAMAAVLRLGQLLSSSLERLLKEHNLGQTAYLMVATLHLARDQTLAMSELGRRLLLHPTTISLTTDQLQARGWVERRPHPSDRRTTLATLTPEGVRALKTVNESLAGQNYGLGGASDRLAITTTEVIRQMRNELGDR